MANIIDTKIYATIEGHNVFGWRILYVNHYRFGDGKTDHVFVDEDTRNLLTIKEDFVKLCDTSFSPQSGDEIYVAPDCPLASAEIRREYKVKRKPDDGVCNVFSELNLRTSWYDSEKIYLYPTEKTVIAFEHNVDTSNLPDITRQENITSDPIIITKKKYLKKCFIPESYQMLLRGELKKLVIYYTALKFNSGNQVTTDALYLVYKTGLEAYTNENKKNFILQLTALSQCNWRDYPGTIKLLLWGYLYNRITTRNRKCAAEIGRTSALPKAIKEMCAWDYDSKTNPSSIKFGSQQDIEMAQSFFEMVFEFGDTKFSSIQKISRMVSEAKVPFEVFYLLYDNIVKIRRTQFKND